MAGQDDSSPTIMTLFEEMAEASTRRIQHPDEDIRYVYEHIQFLDDHLIAAPFAAHCQTLETFAIVERSMRHLFRIERGPGGTPIMEETWTDMHAIGSMWNPQVYRGWI